MICQSGVNNYAQEFTISDDIVVCRRATVTFHLILELCSL
jgi:hypothetical protein